jgi:hypothetical protein
LALLLAARAALRSSARIGWLSHTMVRGRGLSLDGTDTIDSPPARSALIWADGRLRAYSMTQGDTDASASH